MPIKNNLYKLRSSLVRYESFNELLPKRNKYSRRFSDIDMFHTYQGHRLFLELKHHRAKFMRNGGVSSSIRDIFEISMKRGEFCLILWGEYKDFNLDTKDYYSEFIPSSAMVFNPVELTTITHENINLDWLKDFFKYWYDFCDKYTLRGLTDENYRTNQ